LGSSKMITAHVNELGIVLRLSRLSDNLSHDDWEKLLDELKSHYIPSFYQSGKRLHVDLDANTNQMRVVIYFTGSTVTMDEAIAILKKWNFEVHDVRGTSAAS
jgi:hypothetical protein